MNFSLGKNSFRLTDLARFSKEKTKKVLSLFFSDNKVCEDEELPMTSLPGDQPDIQSHSRIETRGLSMPLVGLGTWQVEPSITDGCILYALEHGYRHIDTAYSYGNEEAIGKALSSVIAAGAIDRDDLFITSKLPLYGMTPEGAKFYVEESLKNLRIKYLDLYLIHFPVGINLDKDAYTPDPRTDHIKIWRALEDLVCRGKIKNLGLSNFTTKQVKNILNNAKIAPSNLQIELHLYHQQKNVWDFCADNAISLTAYAPLGSPGLDHFLMMHDLDFSSVPMPLKDPVVNKIAQRYKKTAAQVMLRYLVQNGICVIPKSRHPKRIASNYQIFDFALEPEDMDKLSRLDMGKNGQMFSYVWKGTESHKEYPFDRLTIETYCNCQFGSRSD